ncbi:MAG TPA: lysophospholipid acyltransferase family protein [Anaerolineales bacterium]|nr:lysophospholipid acyltransferase family protein [Anaerolineales bacterium]
MTASTYVHARFEGRRRALRWLIDHFAFRFLIKFDHVEGLEHLPASDAAILMINHIAFVDPIVVMGCMPRNIVPMAKVEAYRYPIVGIFPRIWRAIPVHRGEVDRAALRQAMAVLQAGEVILVAPEGTRSPALGRGREGIAFLGHRSGALVIPTMIEGTQGFPSLSARRWRGPGAVVRLGRPFRFKATSERPGRDGLRLMTDEAMYVLAGHLPEARRGAYADLRKATTSTLEFA